METTPNGLSASDAIAFSDDAEGMPYSRAETYLGLAYRRVARYAPEPVAGFADQAQEDAYREAARDTEKLVFDYLVATRGFVQSESLSGVSSTSYADDKAIERIVADSMGDYYVRPGGDGGAGYYSKVPRARRRSRSSSGWWAP